MFGIFLKFGWFIMSVVHVFSSLTHFVYSNYIVIFFKKSNFCELLKPLPPSPATVYPYFWEHLRVLYCRLSLHLRKFSSRYFSRTLSISPSDLLSTVLLSVSKLWFNVFVFLPYFGEFLSFVLLKCEISRKVRCDVFTVFFFFVAFLAPCQTSVFYLGAFGSFCLCCSC